jgi:hypothetical protein
MIDSSELVEISKLSMREEFDSDQKAFMIKDLSILNDIDDET